MSWLPSLPAWLLPSSSGDTSGLLDSDTYVSVNNEEHKEKKRKLMPSVNYAVGARPATAAPDNYRGVLRTVEESLAQVRTEMQTIEEETKVALEKFRSEMGRREKERHEDLEILQDQLLKSFPRGEIENLERRVDDLERQNRDFERMVNQMCIQVAEMKLETPKKEKKHRMLPEPLRMPERHFQLPTESSQHMAPSHTKVLVDGRIRSVAELAAGPSS